MGYTFGFIGAGNMGGALARAACRWRPEQVVLTDRTLDKAVALAEELDCDIAMDNAAVAREAKFIFLGVKPQMMGDMLAALAPTLEERGGGYVLVSMAAGLTIARLEEMLGFEAPILRIMPNTPAAIGEGMILYAANERVAAADVEEFCDKMVGAGRARCPAAGRPLCTSSSRLWRTGAWPAGCPGPRPWSTPPRRWRARRAWCWPPAAIPAS